MHHKLPKYNKRISLPAPRLALLLFLSPHFILISYFYVKLILLIYDLWSILWLLSVIEFYFWNVSTSALTQSVTTHNCTIRKIWKILDQYIANTERLGLIFPLSFDILASVLIRENVYNLISMECSWQAISCLIVYWTVSDPLWSRA